MITSNWWNKLFVTSDINRENKSSTSSFPELDSAAAILNKGEYRIGKDHRLVCFDRSSSLTEPSLVAHVESSQDLLRRRTTAYCFFMCFLFTFY